MKYFLALLVFIIAINVTAQNKIIVKYYDSLWQPAAKANASFYAEFKSEDTFYRVTSYYYPSTKLYSKSTFADTLFKKGIGLMKRYYETGKIMDSSYFFEDAKNNYSISYTYYPNGHLQDSTFAIGDGTYHHYHYSANGKLNGYSNYNLNNLTTSQFESIGYDESGKIIPHYIYERPAQFSNGGFEGWMHYLTQHLRHDLPVQKGAPAGTYIVVVSFDIDEKGNVVNVVAQNNPGYGTKEEAIRVVSNSPQWIPAIGSNKQVIAHHRQQITFQVVEDKK